MTSATERLQAEAVLELERLEARGDVVAFARRTVVDESTGAVADHLPPHVVRWLRALVDPATTRLCVTGFPGSAKTTSVAVAIARQCLRGAAGLDSVPVIYATASEKVGRDFMRGVQRLATSDFARRAFPEGSRIRWTATSAELPGSGRLPLLVVVGPESRILSRRSALLVADDVQPPQLARYGARDALARSESWFFESLMTRVLDADSRVVVSAAPYSAADLVSQIARRPGWTTIAVRARDAKGRSVWPERFPDAKLAAIEADNPGVFQRTYQLDASVGDARAMFSERAIERALDAGRGLCCAERWTGGRTAVLALDPAFSTERQADASGIAVVAIEQDGARRVVDALELHLSPGDLASEVARLAGRYRPRVVAVEANGAQAAVLALLRARGLRPHPITTTAKSKWDLRLGLPGLAQAWEQGRWVLPSGAHDSAPSPSSARAVAALRAARVDAESHTPDLVMALQLAHEALAKSEGLGPMTSEDLVRTFGFDPRCPR